MTKNCHSCVEISNKSCALRLVYLCVKISSKIWYVANLQIL